MRLRLTVCILGVLLALTPMAHAAEATKTDPDGVITWSPSEAASHVQGHYSPTRWGMYEVEVRLESGAAGKLKASLGDKDLEGDSDGATNVVKLGRIYHDTADARPVEIQTEPADVKKPLVITSVAEPIIAQHGEKGDQGIGFKVDDHRFLELTDRDGVIPAPYLARAKWVLVQDAKSLPDAELKSLIARSRELIVAKLTKKLQLELK